jgi:SAM-dependent methyltransferase
LGIVELNKKMFSGAQLEIDDLLLLESFQISLFPGWVPEKEFAAVLQTRPVIKNFLKVRCPEIASFIDLVLKKQTNLQREEQLESYEDRLIWTLADILVYNKCPEVYDRLPFHCWDFSEITSVVRLEGKIVIDVGSGTGRVAVKAAESAKLVYAVEPVSRLRQYIRKKTQQRNLTNLFVVDGFLHSLPFSDGFSDVTITSHALAWQLENELRELERITMKGGTIIHCPGTADSISERDVTTHKILIGEPWRYKFSVFEEPDPSTGGGRKRKYWKQC